jgi:hypothetical protein
LERYVLLHNAGFCSGRSNKMRAKRGSKNARLQQASLCGTAPTRLMQRPVDDLRIMRWHPRNCGELSSPQSRAI